MLARKPLDGTVAETVLQHGTGALNIDGCRLHADDAKGGEYVVRRLKPGSTLNRTGGNWRPDNESVDYRGFMKPGRWPANIVHDGSAEVAATFMVTAGVELGAYAVTRFYYSAKADADDRLGSKHPTVKPVDLMRWLVRLVTPPGGVVLDPFAGTGTTGEAAWREGMRAVLVEREPAYAEDIRRRMALALEGPAARKVARAKARGKGADAGPLFAAAGDAGGEAAE